MKGKKLLAGVLSAAMVFGTVALPAFADETGTETVNEPETFEQSTTKVDPDYSWYTAENDTYTISDLADLIGFSDISNCKVDFDEDGKGDSVNFSGKTVVLENDIDMSGVKNWLSIGAKSKFQGTFDGQDHTISNFTSISDGFLLSNGSLYGNGFFGNLDGATIKNVAFDNAVVKCVVSGNVFGVAVAYSYGNSVLENISVKNSDIKGFGKVGGILGMAADKKQTTIKDCSVSDTFIDAHYDAGGIAGLVQGTIVSTGNSVSNVTFAKQSANPGQDFCEINTEITCTDSANSCPGAGTKVKGLYMDMYGYYYGGYAEFYIMYGDSSHDCELKDETNRLANSEIMHDAVVSIGDVKYETLADAVAAAQDGDTIKLLDDISLSAPLVISGKNITLDLTDKTIKCEKNYSGATAGTQGIITIKGGANVEITGSGSIVLEKQTKDDSRNACIFVSGQDTVLTFNGCATENNNAGIMAEFNSTVNIKSGKFYSCGGGTGVMSIGAVINIFDGDFSGDESGTGAAWTRDGGVINISGGNFDFPEYDDPDVSKVVNWGLFDWTGMPASYGKPGTIAVTGGTYNFNPTCIKTIEGAPLNNYVAEGYIAVENDGKYTVKKSDIQVEDTAQVVSTTITLNGLEENLKTNHSDLFKDGEQAIYKTVVDAPSADDQTKAASVEKAENAKREMYDIKIVKFVGGVAIDEIPVKNQEVTLTLGTSVKDGEEVKVTHIDSNGVATPIENVKAEGNKVTFTAPSFSTYVVDVVPAAVTDIAENIDVKFTNMVVDGKTATFDLVIAGADGKTINRFTSSEWKFGLTNGFAYEIEPAAYVNMVENTADGTYGFNMDGMTYSDATGKEIKLATVTVTGDGTFEFVAESAKIHATESADNIVTDFDSAASTNTGKVNIDAKAANELKTKKYDLTVNIAFNNAVENNVKAYQDMTVTVSGGDLTDALTYELGSDNADVIYSGGYSLTVSDKLSENTNYTVKVEGAGYRTARYTVTMTGAKTLNFWNNVKSAGNEMYVEEGKGEKKAVTFLAGDIVKDGKINIYDLSAVVSYFGTINDVDAESEYAKYDLNRDGKIDSKDVAYVLVSWDK